MGNGTSKRGSIRDKLIKSVLNDFKKFAIEGANGTPASLNKDGFKEILYVTSF
jgi:hypothetical protein